MMEDHAFCDKCSGCRPAMLDAVTGKALPSDSPLMQIINHVWDHETLYEERKAFIEVTLHNSQLASDVNLAFAVMKKMKAASLRNQ